MKPSYPEILRKLKSLRNNRNIAGMARFGIRGKNVLGIPKPRLAKMAKAIGKDHGLALKLWDSNIHEARILAALIDIPSEVRPGQMEKWVKAFDSWDVCDQVCGNLFDKTPCAPAKALEWSRRKKEFEKRAGFVLMAEMAVHDKKAPDGLFLSFLPVLRRESRDERNFVWKAVNWALRQIGKRNPRLKRAAIAEAKRIQRSGTSSGRWIAADALRELKAKKFQ
jgi:3-methyladenine DNA glycosylase AlkD